MVGNFVPKCRACRGFLKPRWSLGAPLGPEKESEKLDYGRPVNLRESVMLGLRLLAKGLEKIPLPVLPSIVSCLSEARAPKMAFPPRVYCYIPTLSSVPAASDPIELCCLISGGRLSPIDAVGPFEGIK
jgi:hypothetical protein